MIYILTLGDYSGDGHEQSEEFLYDCNYDVHKIRQAYKDSCKKLGIAFNNGEDYTGLHLRYNDERKIWIKYGNKAISKTAFNILNEAGCFNDIDYYEVDEEYFVDDTEDCAKLIMNFIALSMPNDFEYKHVQETKYETINGWWNNELNEEFGYGLFY